MEKLGAHPEAGGRGSAGKRVAEWPAGDAGAHAQVRQRTGEGGSSSSDMIL